MIFKVDRLATKNLRTPKGRVHWLLFFYTWCLKISHDPSLGTPIDV